MPSQVVILANGFAFNQLRTRKLGLFGTVFRASFVWALLLAHNFGGFASLLPLLDFILPHCYSNGYFGASAIALASFPPCTQFPSSAD